MNGLRFTGRSMTAIVRPLSSLLGRKTGKTKGGLMLNRQWKYLALFAVVACAPYTRPQLVPVPAPVVVHAPVASTWAAAIQLITQYGYPIRSLDRENGLITGEPGAQTNRSASLMLADCGSALGIPWAPNYMAWTMLIAGNNVVSTVQMVATFERVGETPTNCYSRGVLERSFAQEIKQRAEAGGH